MCHDNRIKGQLTGIGIGPGDPELLTLKAVKILKEADSIIVPKARDKAESVARDIVSRALGRDLPFEEMVFPMSRNKSELEKHWNLAAERVLERLQTGKNVAFVSLGDISLYSTFSYLTRAIKKMNPHVKPMMIPGISSIQLAAATFQTSLALGDESCGIFPLPLNINDLDRALKLHNNIVVMKIGRRLGELIQYLKEKNLLTNSNFVRRAGFPDEFICTDMENLSEDESGYLSILLIKQEGKK